MTDNRAQIERLHELRDRSRLGGGQARIDKQHEKGKLTARERLELLINRFRRGAEQLGLRLMDSQTPIQPLLAGTSQRALDWSGALERQGILVSAIRPPTVPEGSARLRVTLSAAHSESQVERLLDALARLPRARGG